MFALTRTMFSQRSGFRARMLDFPVTLLGAWPEVQGPKYKAGSTGPEVHVPRGGRKTFPAVPTQIADVVKLVDTLS